jgi:hypothetical protein
LEALLKTATLPPEQQLIVREAIVAAQALRLRSTELGNLAAALSRISADIERLNNAARLMSGPDSALSPLVRRILEFETKHAAARRALDQGEHAVNEAETAFSRVLQKLPAPMKSSP